jgi:hypothetical protein
MRSGPRGVGIEVLNSQFHRVEHSLTAFFSFWHFPDHAIEQPRELFGNARVVFDAVLKRLLPGLQVVEDPLPAERLKALGYRGFPSVCLRGIISPK